MSRSYKKNPGFTDGGSKHCKWAKRQANKKVRKQSLEKIQNGKWYKKLYCSWNIHDWKWIYFSHYELYDRIFGYDEEKTNRFLYQVFSK